jgi:ABC-2 type transport system permease protein
VLIEADASDPTATGVALAAITQLPSVVARRDLTGPLAYLAGKAPPFDVAVHRLYNPESLTQYNIVPGLMGVILTMTMVMMTGSRSRASASAARWRTSRDAAQPARGDDGKIIPYIAIGLDPVGHHLDRGALHFPCSFRGEPRHAVHRGAALHRVQPHRRDHDLVARGKSAAGDAAHVLLFPAQHSSVGLHVSVPRMPEWAQWIGTVLPLTHFNRLSAASCSRATTGPILWLSIWPLLVFMSC